MKNAFKKLGGPFLLRFLSSHLLILVLPILVFIIGFGEVSNLVKKDVLEANLNALERTQYVIDQSLKEMEDLVSVLSASPSLGWLAGRGAPLALEDHARLYESHKSVQTLYNLSSAIVLGYYVLYPGSEIVLSPAGVYSLGGFYGYAYSTEGSTEEAWRQESLNEYKRGRFLPSRTVTLEGKRFEALTYLHSIPINEYGAPRATVMILIDTQKLFAPLASINTEGGNVLIADAQGLILASTQPVDGLPALDGARGYRETARADGSGNYLLSWVVSEQNGFHYAALADSALVLRELNRLQSGITGISLLCFLGAAGLAWLLSYVNAKPLREILNTVLRFGAGPRGEARDGYKYIESALTGLIENDLTLRQRIKESLPMAQANFIGKLFRGEIVDARRAASSIKQLELEFTGDWYNAVVVRLDVRTGTLDVQTLQELGAVKILIRTLWGDYWRERLNWHAWDYSEQAMAFLTVHTGSGPPQGLEDFVRGLSAFRALLERDYSLTVTLETGEGCVNLTDIYYVFSAVRDRTERREPLEDAASAPGSEFHDANEWIYYYPVELEQRLINVIKLSNREELERLIDLIYQENFVKNVMPQDMVNNLFNEIRGTVYKVFKQLGVREYEQIFNISSMLKKIKISADAADRFAETRRLLLYLCGVTEAQEKGETAGLVDAIRSYIQHNFADSGLCLAGIAARFHFSDTNFSYFFKEHFRQNFSTYLERLRIHTACELIASSPLSVEEIAERTGYNSAGSFRRAFKRVKGILPSEYKKLEAHL